jgi:DNA-binding phage protein
LRPMIPPDLSDRIAAAGRRRAKLDAQLRTVTAELHAAIREAHTKGANLSELAREAGISRQAAQQIVGRRRADSIS